MKSARGVPLEQEIEWLGLRFCVPADWQIVRHGVSHEHGSLVLIDRRTQRLTVSWTRCQARPDLERLLRDYHAKQREEGGSGEYCPFASGRYRGFAQHGPQGERLTRAVAFHAPHARLLELLFVEPPGVDDGSLLQTLLDTVEFTAAAELARRVCAFDLDVTPPEGFALSRADVKPLDVTVHFAAREGVVTASLRRLGMASAWHRGTLEQLVQKHWPKASLRSEPSVDASEVTLFGHEAGPLLLRWFGRLRVQRTIAWQRASEDAIYELTTHSLARRPVLPSAFDVKGKRGAPCS